MSYRLPATRVYVRVRRESERRFAKGVCARSRKHKRVIMQPESKCLGNLACVHTDPRFVQPASCSFHRANLALPINAIYSRQKPRPTKSQVNLFYELSKLSLLSVPWLAISKSVLLLFVKSDLIVLSTHPRRLVCCHIFFFFFFNNRTPFRWVRILCHGRRDHYR